MSLILGMAGIGMQFNAGEHKERQIDTVPDGWYAVQIVNSEIKPTKTPGGARLNLQFKVLQGDFAGRVIFGGYNVKNSNPVAVNIAMEELAELSRAVKVPVWNDTEQLHGIPFNLKVKVVKQEGYDDKAEPKQYKPIEEAVVYATKADIKAGAAPVGQAFAQRPQQQQPAQQQPAQQAPTGWGAQTQQQPAQTQQQPVQQEQPVQQQQQPVQQQPAQDAGNVNFQQAAQTQPWGNANTQEQPVQQQPQQQAQQPLEGEHIPANTQQQQPAQTQQQPAWATQQVQPGSEQPAQQVNQQQPVQEQPDDIQQAAQSQTPPWKMQAQE